tara:strand:+ start:269 stop:3118 length:2850 start_codon:yes stop_codon:yes gene_type:complete
MLESLRKSNVIAFPEREEFTVEDARKYEDRLKRSREEAQKVFKGKQVHPVVRSNHVLKQVLAQKKLFPERAYKKFVDGILVPIVKDVVTDDAEREVVAYYTEDRKDPVRGLITSETSIDANSRNANNGGHLVKVRTELPLGTEVDTFVKIFGSKDSFERSLYIQGRLSENESIEDRVLKPRYFDRSLNLVAEPFVEGKQASLEDVAEALVDVNQVSPYHVGIEGRFDVQNFFGNGFKERFVYRAFPHLRKKKNKEGTDLERLTQLYVEEIGRPLELQETGLVHGDPGHNNFLETEDGVKALDWEFAHEGLLVSDLVKAYDDFSNAGLTELSEDEFVENAWNYQEEKYGREREEGIFKVSGGKLSGLEEFKEAYKKAKVHENLKIAARYTELAKDDRKHSQELRGVALNYVNEALELVEDEELKEGINDLFLREGGYHPIFGIEPKAPSRGLHTMMCSASQDPLDVIEDNLVNKPARRKQKVRTGLNVAKWVAPVALLAALSTMNPGDRGKPISHEKIFGERFRNMPVGALVRQGLGEKDRFRIPERNYNLLYEDWVGGGFKENIDDLVRKCRELEKGEDRKYDLKTIDSEFNHSNSIIPNRKMLAAVLNASLTNEELYERLKKEGFRGMIPFSPESLEDHKELAKNFDNERYGGLESTRSFHLANLMLNLSDGGVADKFSQFVLGKEGHKKVQEKAGSGDYIEYREKIPEAQRDFIDLMLYYYPLTNNGKDKTIERDMNSADLGYPFGNDPLARAFEAVPSQHEVLVEHLAQYDSLEYKGQWEVEDVFDSREHVGWFDMSYNAKIMKAAEAYKLPHELFRGIVYAMGCTPYEQLPKGTYERNMGLNFDAMIEHPEIRGEDIGHTRDHYNVAINYGGKILRDLYKENGENIPATLSAYFNDGSLDVQRAVNKAGSNNYADYAPHLENRRQPDLALKYCAKVLGEVVEQSY